MYGLCQMGPAISDYNKRLNSIIRDPINCRGCKNYIYHCRESNHNGKISNLGLLFYPSITHAHTRAHTRADDDDVILFLQKPLILI